MEGYIEKGLFVRKLHPATGVRISVFRNILNDIETATLALMASFQLEFKEKSHVNRMDRGIS